MKALIAILSTAPEGENSGEDLRSCRASLQALGIDHHVAKADAMPTDSYVNTHDFIVFPSVPNNAAFGTIIDDSGITIPMIGLGCLAGAAQLGSTGPGVSGTGGAWADHYYDCVWTSQEYVAAFSKNYVLDGGTPLMTVSATQPSGTGGAAQAAAGRVGAWSAATAGGSKMYFSSLFPPSHAMLPFLLQAAINDGELTAPPRKAPVAVDLDHINGSYAYAEESILDKIASYVPKGGVLWCGIFNANVTYFDNMTASTKAKLRSYQYPRGPFKYCWHDHVFNPSINADIGADGYSNDVTKAEQDTLYQADKAIWEGHGLTFHEENAYYNSGSNAWDEASLELFSYDVSKMSSPANDTVQAGYGFTAFRQTPTSSSRDFEIRGDLYRNLLHNKSKIRGIQRFLTFDMAFGNEPFPDLDMPYDSIVDWRKQFDLICRSISMCHTMYFHDEDFMAAEQDPGTEQHGYVLMQIIADACNYLSDVVNGFADLGQFVPRINQR